MVAANATAIARIGHVTIGTRTVTFTETGTPPVRPTQRFAMAGGGEHTLALKDDGTVWSWGTNTSGQLGDGTTTMRAVPIQIASLANVVAVAAGAAHSLALKSDGTVWAWGKNSTGQLGDGTSTLRLSPIQVPNLTDVMAIAAGADHSVAMKSDGTVWTWGRNTWGQLGDGTQTNRFVRVPLAGVQLACDRRARRIRRCGCAGDATGGARGPQ
jgi:alpha-tubulin suppressor-like RCC1 family protein